MERCVVELAKESRQVPEEGEEFYSSKAKELISHLTLLT